MNFIKEIQVIHHKPNSYYNGKLADHVIVRVRTGMECNVFKEMVTKKFNEKYFHPPDKQWTFFTMEKN